MNYYFTKSLDSTFGKARDRVYKALENEGFCVISEINMQSMFKKKLHVDFYHYEILGTCFPELAHRAMSIEDKIGVMLPYNIIIQQKIVRGPIEISCIDPVKTILPIDNDELNLIALEVQLKLKRVLKSM